MTRTPVLVVTSLVVVSTLTVGAMGQRPKEPAQIQTAGADPRQQMPAFRSRITLVPLDVRVLDRDGRPVTDLTQADFTILEDSEPQIIAHFSAYGLVPETPAELAPPALRQPPADALIPQRTRTVLVVIGRGRIQQPFDAVGAAIQFVRDRLLPQDNVAVMAYNRATDFTTDHDRIVAVLQRLNDRHERIEALLQQYESGPSPIYKKCKTCLPDSIIPKINEIFLWPGAPVSRELPQAIGESQDAFVSRAQRFYDFLVDAELSPGLEGNVLAAEAVSRRAELVGGGSSADFLAGRSIASQDSDKLLNGISLMRYLDGEKQLVFLAANGISLTSADEDAIIARAAADARIALHTIITGGIPASTIVGRVSSGVPRAGATDTSIPSAPAVDLVPGQAMKRLAAETGGVSSLNRYPREALARIDEATRFEYLLGYYPTNSTSDHRFRRIEVKVNRPDVTVLVRGGYYAEDVVIPGDRAAFLAYRRITSVGGYQDNVTDLTLTLKASQAKSPDKAKPGDVMVDLRIDLSRVGFGVVDGRHVAKLDVRIYCGDAHEKVVGETASTVSLNLTAENYKRFLREGLPFTARVPVGSAPRYVKVVVYDGATDLAGSMVTKLK